MKSLRRAGRAGLIFISGLSLIVAVAGNASASPSPAQPVEAVAGAEPSAAVTPAACPQPGQRVKQSAFPQVYVVDPNYILRLIPNETVYFNLWDSWAGIVIYNDLVACYPTYRSLNNAYLAKLTVSPEVYIWDAWYGYYRHITSATVFNKYAFSWGKIRSQTVVGPINPNHTWNF
jgi:hypothetical protein